MPKKDNSKTFYALSFAWQLGYLIVVPVTGFLLLGLWIDKKIDTSPLVLIIGTILGIVITVYELYHLILVLIKK